MSKQIQYVNKYQLFFQSKFLKKMYSYPLVGLFTHWLFQGILNMDPTEIVFKIFLDILVTLLVAWPLSHFLKYWITWPISFIIAHTLNFLFNGQIWIALKSYGHGNISKESFDLYVNGLRERALKENSIQSILIFGSLSRHAWNNKSDLDARILHHSGIINGIRACVFLLKERTRAVVTRFPLDMYLIDKGFYLHKLRPDELPINLLELHK